MKPKLKRNIKTDLKIEEIIEQLKKYSLPYAEDARLKIFFEIHFEPENPRKFQLIPSGNTWPRYTHMVPILNCTIEEDETHRALNVYPTIATRHKLLLYLVLVLNLAIYIQAMQSGIPVVFPSDYFAMGYPMSLLVIALMFRGFFTSQVSTQIAILKRLING